MDRTELFQAVTLWFVVILTITTTDSSSDVLEFIIVIVGLPLFYLLPLYILFQLSRIVWTRVTA